MGNTWQGLPRLWYPLWIVGRRYFCLYKELVHVMNHWLVIEDEMWHERRKTNMAAGHCTVWLGADGPVYRSSMFKMWWWVRSWGFCWRKLMNSICFMIVFGFLYRSKYDAILFCVWGIAQIYERGNCVQIRRWRSDTVVRVFGKQVNCIRHDERSALSCMDCTGLIGWNYFLFPCCVEEVGAEGKSTPT